MHLEDIIKNISDEDRFEHTVDALIVETESDKHYYQEIMLACRNLTAILQKAPSDKAFVELVSVLRESAIHKMTELRENVECSLELNDILTHSKYCSNPVINQKVFTLFDLNCKMYDLCLACEDKLQRL